MSPHDDYAASAGHELRNAHAPSLLLLLHGLGGDRNQPLDLIAGQELPGLTVLAPDARAHGTTAENGAAETFRFTSMAADLETIVALLGQRGKPTYVAGISMGAALALRLILSTTLDVRGVAFIRPAFTDVPSPANLAMMPEIASALDRYGADEGLRRFEATEAYRAVAAVSPAAAESLRGQFSSPNARRRRGRLIEIPRNRAYESTSELAAVTVPSLVVAAPGDPVHPFGIAEDWAGALPAGRLVAVPSRDVDSVGYRRMQQSAVLEHMSRVLPGLTETAQR